MLKAKYDYGHYVSYNYSAGRGNNTTMTVKPEDVSVCDIYINDKPNTSISSIDYFDVAKASKIKSLDGIKNVKFVPHTKFNRALFKQMYPSINVRRDTDKAEAVIYDEYSINVNRTCAYRALYFCPQHNIYVESSLQYQLRHINTPVQIGPYLFDKNSLDIAAGVFYYCDIKEIDNISSLMTYNVPLIHVNDVFSTADTSMRQESISFDDLTKIADQVFHKDLNIRKLGIEILSELDMKKYLPIQVFLFNSADTRGVKSPKIDVFSSYLAKVNLNLNYAYTNRNSDRVMALIYKIVHNIRLWDSNEFNEDMDYAIFDKFIHLYYKNFISKNMIDGSYAKYCKLEEFKLEITHPKYKKESAVPIPQPTQQNKWILT